MSTSSSTCTCTCTCSTCTGTYILFVVLVLVLVVLVLGTCSTCTCTCSTCTYLTPYNVLGPMPDYMFWGHHTLSIPVTYMYMYYTLYMVSCKTNFQLKLSLANFSSIEIISIVNETEDMENCLPN